jgi:hypothetical protein
MNVNQVKAIIKSQAASKRAVMLWGAPGIGKSDAVNQSAIEMSHGDVQFVVKDIRLSQTDPTDLKGIPWVEKVMNSTYARDEEGNYILNEDETEYVQVEESVTLCRWAVPDFLPFEWRDGPNGILFLDEINSAPPSCQAAAYQLVLDRRLGDYYLPEGWRIICAGNRQGDGGVAYKMPTPLANRMFHTDIEADFSVWKEWAYSSETDEWVIGFLNQHPQHLMAFDAKKSGTAFATPRTWQFVSEVVQDGTIDERTQHLMIAGAVGEGMATEFVAFCMYASQLPDLDAVLRGEEVEMPSEPSACYAAVTSLVAKLTLKAGTKGVGDMIDHAVQFAAKMPIEYAVLMIKDMTTVGKLKRHVNESAAVSQWCQDNGDQLE